jgi:ribosome-associated protein
VEVRWDVAGTVALSDAERRRVMRKLANRITNDGILIVRASDHRSQHRNREEARTRLRKLVAGALQRRKERRATKPSRAAKRRRVEDKRRRGEVKRLRQPPGT